jgi:tetratricopeptide (TPR) repeat protein
LVRTLLSLRQQRRTGIVKIDAAGTRTFVYLRDGIPVFAEEGSGGETLGRLLVRLRLLTKDQYLEVLSKMTDALVYNEQIRFGETAVELGHLSETQVREALHDQVRWKVIRCFQRDELTWTFEDGASHVEDAGDFPMSIEALVFGAVMWLDRERRLELGLAGVLDKFVQVPAAERAGLATRLGLEQSLAPGFAVLNGDTRVRDLLERGVGAAFDLEAVLTSMVMLGYGGFSTEKPEAPRRDAAQAAPPSDRRHERASVSPPPIDRLRASQVLRRIDSVIRNFQTNDADIFREPSCEHERRLLGEQAFQRGRAHLDGARLPQATSAFRRAVHLAPENTEYALYALWCDLKEKLAETAPTALLKRAASAAVRTDPNLAFGYYVLGRIAFVASEHDKAVRFFRRTLALDSAMKDAERHLRLSESRATKPQR